MPQLLRDLITLLSREVSLDDLASSLGPTARDPGAPLPAALTPRDPGLRRIEVGRYPDTGKPFTVDVELAAPVTVASLVAELGAYRQARTDRGQPREIAFPPTGAGPWHVVVLAQLPPGSSPIDDAQTTALTLRRDPR